MIIDIGASDVNNYHLN